MELCAKLVRTLLVSLLVSGVSAAENCACGPSFCLNTSAYEAALKAKKAAAKADGAPSRLVVLYDRLGACEACIDSSPDSFNILRQEAGGLVAVDGWTQDNERIGALGVKSGDLKACYVILSRRWFSCCNAKKYFERADYDAVLDLNVDLAARCEE